jgi:adenylate kinase family enzyme
MRRVAVFGNAGGGKSTLARRLAALTGLPLHTIDMMQFRAGGHEVPEAEFREVHARLLDCDAWIIDGFGSVETAWERFERADTLVHVDLPLPSHFWGVTKRLVRGHFAAPEGWPEGSPLWRSSLSSYRVLLPCHRKLTPRYRSLVADATKTKRVHALRSPAEIAAFVDAVRREAGQA